MFLGHQTSVRTCSLHSKSVPEISASVPLDYSMDSIGKGPLATPGQNILQMIISPSKLTVIPTNAVAGNLKEQDQEHEEQEE